MKLKRQVAIVTGASRGIGEAIALTLAGEGAAVVVNGRQAETINRVADEIRSRGGQALPVKADVSSSEQVNDMVAQTLESFQKIDILVNNAGINKLMPTLELPEALWDDIIDTNLKGQFLCCQAVAKHMIKRKQGKIVNIASIGGHIGTPGLAAYSASKGGSLQLTRVLAVEWGKHNITVNAVSPGLTMTAMMEALVNERSDFVDGMDRIPLQRLAKPEDIADAVLFLVSPGADYITGQEIIVDGGTTVIHPRLVKPLG
jgi:NAD(P)-dependent dehydrogenase (short-subunit alcohol dehydrogenase family)